MGALARSHLRSLEFPIPESIMNRLAHILAAAALAAQAPLPATADPIRTDAEHCVVNIRTDDSLNLRAGPGVGHGVLSRLPYARCGIIVTGACAGSWCPAEDGHNAGWVNRRYIASVPDSANCLGASSSQPVALRAWPSDGSRVLTRLTPRSCGVALLPYATNGWQKIRQGGWEGWVHHSSLQPQGSGKR